MSSTVSGTWRSAGPASSPASGPASDPVREVAVVGSGVAGLTAAYVLSRECRVTLYEADHRPGGHADTHEVRLGGGRTIAVDTGFIVHNERTYPVLLRIFRELGIATQPSEMSMSVRDDAIDLEYAGALGVWGLFPARRNATWPAYWAMLAEIPRFHRMARRLLARDETDSDETLGAFLARGRFSPLFRTHFMESLVACVWSCDPALAQEYPARYLFTFLAHHGMLQVFGSPQWRTVTGGSAQYVRRIVEALPEVRLGTKVTSVAETRDGVEISDGNGVTARFDAVVIATHPDQALAMLAEPTRAQREVLGAIGYSANTAQLHTDSSLLPRAPRARASWNYLRRPEALRGGAVTVTYDLTRLMRLPVPADGRRFLVTLGGVDLVDPDTVIDTMEYAHPLYTPTSVAAQRRLTDAHTDRIAFAGAWTGWGFHEDGARSGVAAAARLGFGWPEQEAGQRPHETRTPLPAAYRTTITHTRRTPFHRSFTHRSYSWLVDLDHLPDLGVLGRFEARDHLGDPARSLRENVEAFLAESGIALGETPGAGRILMAAHARALGRCFNPISVFWCFDADDRLAGVVVEVHNTYGERHAYLVHPDAQGRARVDKALYVSPFHGTDGWYDVHVPVPGERLDVAITLNTDDGARFSASLRGERTQTPAWRTAPATLRTSALIRAHGVWLWARRLPIRPRPTHPPQEGLQ